MINLELINLENYLKKNINNLFGEFVKINKGYEKLICDNLTKFQVDTNRYWDAIWEHNNTPIHIEFKKGKSIWIDLVRYSEIKLKSCPDAQKETITLFFIPDRNKKYIEKIVGMKTTNILIKLNLNEEEASFFINMNNKLPRSLNAQASLTVNDVIEISDFIIER